MTDLTLNVTKTIRAPIEKVFDAWLDVKMLSQFMLPMPGMRHPKIKNDPKEGKRFTILMYVGDDEMPHTGKYLEISRPNKLVFSWVSEFSPDGSVVTIIFSEVENNQTKVELNHVKFIDEESRNNHEGGWGNILNVLETVLL